MLYLCDIHGRHLRQHVDEGAAGASVEPVVAHPLLLEGVHQAERVVHVGLPVAEVIAVVHALQLFYLLVVAQAVGLAKALNVGAHLRGQLILGDAAKGIVGRHHRDVLQVVQLTEDAHL